MKYPPNHIPAMCLPINGLDTSVITPAARKYTFQPEVINWITVNMAGKVMIVEHIETAGEHPDLRKFFSHDEDKILWHLVKFENERDLMTFKLFWL